jgi:hypothetical protein
MSGEARCAHVARRTVNGACWRGQCSDGRCRVRFRVLDRAPPGMRIDEMLSQRDLRAESVTV